uniref:Reverse transcriptase zinc-binding domain-containing protein n=1 Tax=Micrurus spixii TaxID=129469 RepID=A0A2D4LHQ7_9SAUR
MPSCGTPVTKVTQIFRHTLRKPLLKIWLDIRKHYNKVPLWLSTMEAMFHRNTMDISKKILRYYQILDEEGNLESIQELEKQKIMIAHWSYFQITIRHKKDLKEFGIETKNSKLDKILLGQDKNMISKLYNYLLQYDLAEEILKGPMIAWARNFGYNIQLEEWEEIWQRNLSITKTVSYEETLYKMIYRWHLASSRLSKIYPTANPTCWKCKVNHGTFYHLWWTCPVIKTFWIRIKTWLEKNPKLR